MNDDDKQIALQELHDLMARTVAILNVMEEMEHRVGTIIEGGRQQLSHVVSDLRLKEMRAELREIKTSMETIARKL